MKRLFLDIEVSPNIVMAWRTGYKIDLNYDGIVKERTIICACYSWQGQERVYSLAWDKHQDDRALLEELLPVMEEADEIVGHYIDGFDLPWIKTRALKHDLDMLPKYKTIDTKAWASKHFYFNSNKLDYISQFLGSGGKIKTDFQLWKDVMAGSAGALERMVRYCKGDIRELKFVHSKLERAVPHKTHEGLLQGKAKWSCPKCASEQVRVGKYGVTAAGTQRYKVTCEACGAHYTITKAVAEAQFAGGGSAVQVHNPNL
jgi:hypothetical protein